MSIGRPSDLLRMEVVSEADEGLTSGSASDLTSAFTCLLFFTWKMREIALFLAAGAADSSTLTTELGRGCDA